MNWTGQIVPQREPDYRPDRSWPDATRADDLPAIAVAPTGAALWDALHRFCSKAGIAEICFVDMVSSGRHAEIIRTTFAPHFCLEKLRKHLVRVGTAMVMDDRTLALPGFGPRGLEAALVVMVKEQACAEAEWIHKLSVAFQLAYSRFRQLRPIERGDDVSLSEREREIMLWVMRGKSNAVIAEILGISASTVDTYMRRIFRKLDVADRTSAAMRAVAIGAVA